jgi:phage regulator Rha-like protein
MVELQITKSNLLKESQLIERLLLEICDPDTRALLHLADISIWPCGCPPKPTLTVTCKSREVAEAIGIRQKYIKRKLKQIAEYPVALAIHYNIPEGMVFFDTEGEVAPAKWYLCNRRDIGKNKLIPLPG